MAVQIPVLVETILGLARTVEGETKIEVEENDFFVGGRPGFVAAGGEDFVEEGEGGVGLLDGYQLLCDGEIRKRGSKELEGEA